MKILVIQTAFLGDLVLTTAFLHQLKLLYPQSLLHVVVAKGTETILEGQPDCDLVIPIDKRLFKKSWIAFGKFVWRLRRERYDRVYAPHFSFRSSLVSWFTGAKIRIGYKESGFSFLHTKTVHRPVRGMHEVDKLFALLELKEELTSEKRRPILGISTQIETEFFRKFPSLREKNYLILAPSSVWETKRMPESKFSELIDLLLSKTVVNLVLIGSKADTELVQRILEPLGEKEQKKERIFSLAGQTSLQELAICIKHAMAVISNDSSPIHFASAFNRPTVMIYGATIPEFGYFPLSDQFRLAEVQGLECRPCGIHGGRVCPQQHFRCMRDQDVEKIWKLLEEVTPR